MNVEHKGSHKADRTELLKSPPQFSELIHNIKNIPDLTKADKAFFALAIGTGSRVSEICNVRARDITFIESGTGRHLEFDDVHEVNVSKLNIVFDNLKNKKNKIKTASIIRNVVFVDIVRWIIERYQEIGPNNLDEKMYPKSRKSAYWLTKKLGDNWFPHIFRHYYISNLARVGVSPQIIKVAAGWASLDNWNTYAHLTTKEIEAELKKHYGDYIPVGGERPLKMHEMLGAVAAKTEVEEKLVRTEKNQLRKESILEINGERRIVRLPRKAREIKERLKNDTPRPVIVTKKDFSDILQVV